MSALTGRRVVVTRASDQAESLCAALAEHGAIPIRFPTIAVAPVADTSAVDRAVRTIERYAWVVFTSANGVRFFVDRWEDLRPGGWPIAVPIAAVGPATAQAARERGLTVSAMPEAFRGDALPATLQNLAGRRVLLPRADIGRQAIVDALVAAGAEVDDLTVYHTVRADPTPEQLTELRKGADVITFTSPSTVRHFLGILGDEGRDMLRRAIVASIGPVTTVAAKAEGVRVDVQPDEYTIGGLVQALARHEEVTA